MKTRPASSRRLVLTMTLITLCASLPGASSLTRGELPLQLPRALALGDSLADPLAGTDLSRFLTRRTLTILAVGATAAALSWPQEDPDRMQQALDGSSLEPVLDFGDAYGSGWTVGGGSLALLAAGSAIGHDGMKNFGADLCRSYIFSFATTFAIKFAVNRRRPSGGDLSFPSGHTTAAFCAVPVVAHHLGWQAGAAAAAVAVSTGLGRMEDRRHYLSDVLFGAAVGLAVGDAVIQRRKTEHLLSGLTVAPDLIGYTITF